ncbi:MAG: WD40 repeat domain-containing protein [Desulfobacteraceae bacterium]|nr:MAG: WD40 repeat domain-containing protein [Desulfobacteraceae bacterium]
MSKFKKPEFLLQKILSDGSAEEPRIHQIDELDWEWNMGRRGFLTTTAVGLALLGGLAQGGASQAEEPAPSSCDKSVKAHLYEVPALVFSPDGTWLVSGGTDKNIKIWSLPEAQWSKTLLPQSAAVTCLAFSRDGALLAAGCEDGSLTLWSFPEGRLLKALSGHTDKIVSLAFSADSGLLASGSGDHTIRIWSVLSGAELNKTIDYSAKSFPCAFKPGEAILFFGTGYSVESWQIRSPKPVIFSTGNPLSLTFSPDGRFLAIGSENKKIVFWLLPSPFPLLELTDRADAIRELFWSANGKIVYRTGQKTWRILEIPMEKLNELAAKRDDFFLPHMVKDMIKDKELISVPGTVTISPDGQWIAAGGNDGTVRLFDAPGREWTACLFDPAAVPPDKKMNQFLKKTAAGRTTRVTQPCATALPPDAVCACHCVAGTYVPPVAPAGSGTGSGPRTTTPGGRSYCSCNQVCTCVPIK